jgi:hypothetical protein
LSADGSSASTFADLTEGGWCPRPVCPERATTMAWSVKPSYRRVLALKAFLAVANRNWPPGKRNAAPNDEGGGVSTEIQSTNDSSASSYKPRTVNSATHVALIHSRKAGRRWDVEFEGEVLVRGSRDPECDLARALLAKGISGTVTVVDRRSRKPRTIVNIERDSKRTVHEDRRKGPCFVRWKPLTKTARQRVEGRAPTAKRAAPKDQDRG